MVSVGLSISDFRLPASRFLQPPMGTDIFFVGRSVSSRDLVPGDVFEFSDPSLHQVPCDCILLSGDCIVNESMLTG